MFLRALCGSVLSLCLFAAEPAVQDLTPPKIGPVQLFPADQVRPGMHAVAWTVFQGTEPEPIPIEIVGTWKNQWGPKQDLILAKMYGKAQKTYAAAGMSGSPVYIDGKLVGAISNRIGAFTSDALCGITPISLMMEVGDYDKGPAMQVASSVSGLLKQLQPVASAPGEAPITTPIATPISFSGFTTAAVSAFSPLFTNIGAAVTQGGAGGPDATTPAKDWKTALRPGQSVAAVLVSGDMGMTAMGTVTYNDGKRVLAFGHPMFNLGAIDMPMAKEDVVMTIGSTYQPTKVGNLSEIVGALHEDRHSAIEGQLGATAQMIPVTIRVRALGDNDAVQKTREFHFHVVVNQKWTPNLMMITLFNSLSNLNDFSEESTYRLHSTMKVEGEPPIELNTMQAPVEAPIPAPMLLSAWWGEKFNRLYVNSAKLPKVDAVNLDVDLLPDRRIAQIESAWIADSKVTPGTELPVKVFLRPYHGQRIERTVQVKIPAGMARGEHEILFSDADTLSRFQNIAGNLNRIEDIPQTVALLNEERSNNRMYVSLLESQPTVYSDEKVLPDVPASVLNVMQSGRATNHEFVSAPESAHEQASVPFNLVVTGSYSLKIHVN